MSYPAIRANAPLLLLLLLRVTGFCVGNPTVTVELPALISYLAFTLMGWVSWPLYIFVFLASFSALWWPNIWPKMGFPELFEKTIGSIHYTLGIYPYGASLLTPIHFRVPSFIFGPLVAKYLAENGVSGTFWKNYWLNRFHTGHSSLWGESLDPYTFSCS